MNNLNKRNSKLIITAGDISSSPVLGKRFRGKTIKEVYWCGKGILVTGSVAKPLAVAAGQVPAEFTKWVVYTAVDQVGESIIGYVSGLGFVKYLYKDN